MRRLLSWLLVVIFLAMSGPLQAAMAGSWFAQNRAFLAGRSTTKTLRFFGTVLGFSRIPRASYNARRELTASSNDGAQHQHLETHYGLDQNDDLTNNNDTTFKSNGADQLLQAGSTALSFAYNDQTAPALDAQYLYDGNGQWARVNGKAQKFRGNGGNIAKEYKPDGTIRADYQLGAGARIDGKWQFYLSDIRGSTLGVAEDTGKRIATWDYSDYGTTTQTSGSTSLYQPMLYTHSELDTETGYYHNKARHYAPKFGKFLARDPIASNNLYSYCHGDPINFSDPSGMDDVDNKPGAPDDPIEMKYQQMRAEAIRQGYLADPPQYPLFNLSPKEAIAVHYLLLSLATVTGGLGGPRYVGLSTEAAEASCIGMRGGGGHAIRHMMKEGIIGSTGSLASRVASFSERVRPILTSPSRVFNWKLGDTAAKGYVGKIGSQDAVVFVAQAGKYTGKVIGSVVPDSAQKIQWGIK